MYVQLSNTNHLISIDRFLIVIFTDKADKMAEIEKNERQIQQQQERDDEMREMALRLRRR